MITVNDDKDLGRAIKNGEDSVYIEGDLMRKVIIIKATGNVAWAVVAAAVTISVVAILAAPATLGTSNSVHFVTAPVVITSLGGSAGTAATAVSIAVAGGGVAVLNKLRKYKITEKTDKYLIISKK